MSETAYLPFLQQTLSYFDRPHEGPAISPVQSPAAWKRADLEGAPWRIRLDDQEVDELRAAVSHWMGRRRGLEEMTRTEFPLPTLAPKVATWRSEVADGRGLQVVSGVPVHDWTVEEASVFFWGLGQHLGRPGAQNRRGDMLYNGEF